MKKRKILNIIVKCCFICVAVGVIGVFTLFAISGYVKNQSKDRIVTVEELNSREEKADAIIVLGAQVKPDGSLSLMLKERVDMGIQLYETGVADKIIMSGDHGTQTYDEVNTKETLTGS